MICNDCGIEVGRRHNTIEGVVVCYPCSHQRSEDYDKAKAELAALGQEAIDLCIRLSESTDAADFKDASQEICSIGNRAIAARGKKGTP